MSNHRALLNRLAISGFMLVVPLSSVYAQDATAVGERLKAALSKQDMTLTWDKISGDTAKMIIEGAKLSMPGEATQLPVGTITLTDIKEDAGNFVAGTATLPNYTTTQEGLTLSMTGIGFTNLRLPPQDSTDPIASFLMYETADMESLSVKMGDKQAFAMDRLHFEVEPPVDGNPMAFSGAADKFSADLSLVEDADTRKLIEALGLVDLNGTFDLAGYWQPTDGRLAIEQYNVSVDNAGTLGLSFDFGGYTPAFIKSMQDLQKTMAAAPEGSDTSAQGLAMLGLMQQLNFHSASIRFDDASLTGKILAYLADQQKIKPADVANQAKAILPFMMAQLNDADLTAQVTGAVNTYLGDPKSIEVSAEPENPVPFAVIMAGAMAQSPKDLVKVLGVSVTANEPAADEGEDGAE